MVEKALVRTIIGIIGNAISFFLFASPLPTFIRIFKRKSVEEFKVDPYLATMMNCLLWILYGMPLVKPNGLLIVTINTIGLTMEISYITLFFIYADTRGKMKIIVWTMIEGACFGIVAMCTLLQFHTHEKRVATVGILCVVFGVLMYASPLTIMSKVIKTKSVKYMSFYLSLANFLNGATWLVYGQLPFDLYITVSISLFRLEMAWGLGALSGTVQLILYAWYYKSTPKDDVSKPHDTKSAKIDVEANGGSKPAI